MRVVVGSRVPGVPCVEKVVQPHLNGGAAGWRHGGEETAAEDGEAGVVWRTEHGAVEQDELTQCSGSSSRIAAGDVVVVLGGECV